MLGFLYRLLSFCGAEDVKLLRFCWPGILFMRKRQIQFYIYAASSVKAVISNGVHNPVSSLSDLGDFQFEADLS